MNYKSPHTRALVNVVKRAADKTYEPDVLAHELGHASLHKDRPYLMPILQSAPFAGALVRAATGSPWGLAGYIPPLADEAQASVKAKKMLEDWEVPEESRKAARKRLGLAFASHATGPAVDAGLTIGAIAADNRALAVTAPFAGFAADYLSKPIYTRAINSIPIEGLPREKIRALSKRTEPDVDVYLANKPVPSIGMYVGKSPLEMTDERLKEDLLRRRLEPLVGRVSSGKLVRKGGVVIGPSE